MLPPESISKHVSPLKRLRRRAEAVLFAAFAAMVPLWPWPIARRLARGWGWLAYLLLRHDRQVAHANLDIVLGDRLTRRQKARIVRRAFQRLASNLVDLLWAPGLTRQRMERLVDFTEMGTALERYRAEGRGVLILTAHYGDWEVLGLAVGFFGFPVLIVTEPTPNARVGATIDRCREACGNRVVPPRHAALKLFRGLRRGERVGVMVDVNGRRGRGGAWLDFFGLPVFNATAAAEVALRSGAAVVFAEARPLPDGRTKILCRTGIEITPTGDHDADVRALSQRFLDCCRDLILRDPEPWLWTYKRWKRRPTAERGKFPFYSKHLEPDQA